MNDILFAKVNLPLLDKKEAVERIIEIDSEHWFWDDYRATNMLPLMTKSSRYGKDGSSNKGTGEFEWLPYTPTVIKDWFEEIVFPWMGVRTRIMVLKTVPNFANLEHIDCNLDEVGNLQHKFRVVVQGRTDTLYFNTRQGVINVPDVDAPFIMDGGWPHGMTNTSDEPKYTIAAGAPWCGLDRYTNISVLMKRSDYDLPADLSTYLKKLS